MTLRQLALNIPRWHSQEADENEIGVDQRRFQKQEHDEAQKGEADVKKILDPPSLNPFLFFFHIRRGGKWCRPPDPTARVKYIGRSGEDKRAFRFGCNSNWRSEARP